MNTTAVGVTIRLLKLLLGWNRWSEPQKQNLHHRAAVSAYRLRAVIATLVCWLPIPLPTLLRLSGSDKHQPHGHRYGRAYARNFARFRYRRIKLLEIGIGGYGYALGSKSLNAWQAYFPRGRIVACDIEEKPNLETLGTRIYRVDQSSAADLAALQQHEGPFDIIIDDGSHLSRHQIFTFRHLFDALSDGGLYVIEDVMTSLWSFGNWDGAHIDSPAFGATCLGYFLALTPYLNADEFESDRAVDTELAGLAGKIRSIQFEKNLIIVERRSGSAGATAINRSRAALAPQPADHRGAPKVVPVTPKQKNRDFSVKTPPRPLGTASKTW